MRARAPCALLRRVNDPREQGEVIAKSTRTISLRNWPFVVFLVFLAAVIGVPMGWLSGNWLFTAGAFGAIFIVPGIVFVIERFGGRRVDEVRANGVTWRWGSARGFVPWSQLRLESKQVQTEDGSVTVWFLTTAQPGVPRIALHGLSRDAHDFLSTKLAR